MGHVIGDIVAADIPYRTAKQRGAGQVLSM
jgi:hypothetical protein